RASCSSPELASANTAQLVLPSRARTSIRRMMPSGPGAAETSSRSVSVRWRSAASVRSIACASVRTLIASTARAGERPTTIMVSIAVTQPRMNCNRRPPSFTPVDPFAGLTQFRERPRQVELYGDLRRFRGPPALVGGGTAPAPRGQVGEKAQEFHEVAMVSTILPTCALVSMRACTAAACASGNVLSMSGLTPRRDQRQHVLLHGAGDRALVGDRARAQGRTGVGETLEHDAAKIDRGLPAALKRDLHGCGFVVALDVVAADHVEDDVGALAVGRGLRRGDEIFAPIVNGDVGTKAAAGIAFFRRAGGGDDARAQCLGELDRGGADSRRAATDQQRLAGLQPPALEGV